MRWKIAQAAELRWWKRYLKNKNEPAYLQWKENYWKGFIKKTGLHFAKNECLLEVGCGPAGIFIALPKHPIHAVDPLINQYEKKIAHFKKADYPNVVFFASPFEKFEINQSYDKVFCLNAINHVADLPSCLDKLGEGLKPGGQLILSVDAHNHSPFKKLFRMIPADILHPHQFNLEEYRQMLLERNLTIENSLTFKKEFFFNYYILIAKK